jgi:hypothetical protein
MTTSPQMATVDLIDDERNFAWQAIYPWLCSASGKPFAYQVLRLPWKEFAEQAYRRAHAVSAGAPPTHLDVQTDALLALLDADYVEHRLRDCGQSLQTLGDGWESLARKLCGR